LTQRPESHEPFGPSNRVEGQYRETALSLTLAAEVRHMNRVMNAQARPTFSSSARAVVWVSRDHAAIAMADRDGRIRTCEIDRGRWSAPKFLNTITRTVGRRDRVAILGPTAERLRLEREYVADFGRPDHLVDVESRGPIPLGDLVSRLRRMS
jgi:hypothetical protein